MTCLLIQKTWGTSSPRNTAPISEGAGLGIRPSIIESGQSAPCPAFVGRRATSKALRQGASAWAPWNEWKDVDALRANLRTEVAIAQFILDYWPELEASGVAQHLEPRSNVTLSAAMPKSLGKIKAGGDFGKDELRAVARNRANKVDKAQVIVMGHTHIPDECDSTHKVRYFNPGSWTRYVDLSRHPGLSLDDLWVEADFPYSLKYGQIDLCDDGRLSATMETFKEQSARFA